MNKRISSLLLCFALIFTMSVAAVPAWAESQVELRINADKGTAAPGDTINYTISVGAITGMGGMEFRIKIPAGLTVDESSISIPEDLAGKIDSDGPIIKPTSSNNYYWCYTAQTEGYTGTSDLVVLSFSCKVDDGATGSKELTIYDVELYDQTTADIEYRITSATVNIALPHTHSMTEVAAKAATCTEAGNSAYYKCDGCGKWFEDATGNVEITDHSSVVIAALGHNYTERILDDVHKKDTAADCRSHDTYWYDCTRGNHNAKDDPAATDKWFESDNAGAHAYDTAVWGYKGTDGHAHKCQYDDTHDAPAAHTPGAAATEAMPQTCTECGYVLHEALGHTHSMTEVAAKAATCTEAGNSAYYKCDGCGKWFEDAAGNTEITNHDSVVISAFGHDYTERILDDAHKKDTAADCRSHDTYWYDCTRGDHNAKDDPAASDKWFESDNTGAHVYDTATWDYKGADGHAHKCQYDDAHDTPAAHNPGAEATETTPQTCTECGYVIHEALGHTHSMTEVAAKAATCTAAGNSAYYKCDGCGKWFEDAAGNTEITNHDSVVISALGHDYTERILDDAHKKDIAADCRSHDTYWYDCTRGDHNAKDDPVATDKWYESTNAGAHAYDTTTWGYKGADGHAHKCQYDDTHDAVVAHIFGTDNKCTECGYTKPSTGGSYRPSIQKPDITIIGSGKADLSADGRTAAIAAEEGSELVSITLNGKEVAKTDKLTGLKTGDKVVITFQKKAEDPAVVAKTVATKVSQMQLIARSSKTAKKNIQVTVKSDAKTAALIKDIQDLGYTVKYKFYRSTRKSASYKAMLTKDTGKYLNTAGKKGTMYYYKARVMVYDKEGKLVAQSELTQCKYANRLWTK